MGLFQIVGSARIEIGSKIVVAPESDVQIGPPERPQFRLVTPYKCVKPNRRRYWVESPPGRDAACLSSQPPLSTNPLPPIKSARRGASVRSAKTNDREPSHLRPPGGPNEGAPPRSGRAVLPGSDS